MKKLVKKLLMRPGLNTLLRRCVRSFAVRSHNLSATLIRYLHVSGVVNIVIEGQSISLASQGDDALVSKLYYNSEWEKNVTGWFSKFCTKYHSVVDAGANIGIFSLLAAKTNVQAVVHAFEPNPHNFLRLRQNIRLNKLEDRVFPHQVALGNVSGHWRFHLPADARISDVSSVYRSHATSFNDFTHCEIEIQAVTLDEFCEQYSVVPQLIKIDVELYELQVLEGMRSILARWRPFVFCEIFNDEVKRKLNPALDAELEKGYTTKVERLLESVYYYFYAMVPGGILHVESLKGSHGASVYLLLPKKLKHPFYLSSESDVVLDELNRG